MIYHDAKIDKPPKSGMYLVIYVFENKYSTKHEKKLYNFSDVEYDKEHDGWNISIGGNRKTEIFPDFWAELPTYDEVIENLKGGERNGSDFACEES